MSCPKHKTYKAIKPPRAKCIFCWKMYMEKNPEKVTVEQVKNVVNLMKELLAS